MSDLEDTDQIVRDVFDELSECVCPDRPEIGEGTSFRRSAWECGRCGRIWTPVVGPISVWWEETRGPKADLPVIQFRERIGQYEETKTVIGAELRDLPS